MVICYGSYRRLTHKESSLIPFTQYVNIIYKHLKSEKISHKNPHVSQVAAWAAVDRGRISVRQVLCGSSELTLPTALYQGCFTPSQYLPGPWRHLSWEPRSKRHHGRELHKTGKKFFGKICDIWSNEHNNNNKKSLLLYATATVQLSECARISWQLTLKCIKE